MSWAELLQLEWRAPAWGLIALMPLLFNVLADWRKQQLSRYAEPHLQAWATRQGHPVHISIGHIFRTWLFWLLTACALAGPRLPLELIDSRHQTRHDMDVVVVLDVSVSMSATDIAPTRIARAKLKLQDLTTRLHGERIALIAYAGEAGLLLPLTRDVEALNSNLILAQENLFEERGSNVAAALDLARNTLHDRKRSRAVLLISDAEASSLSGAAGMNAILATRALEAAGIPLYVWVIASSEGGAIPSSQNSSLQKLNAVTSRPDLDSYQSLIGSRGGKLMQVRDDDSDLRALYEQGILTLPASKGGLDKTRSWRELFSYPLALALLLLLVNNLRLPRRGVIGAVAVVAASSVQANDVIWRESYQAYVQKQYLVAQQGYRTLVGFDARMGEGTAAYRRKDYVYAQRQFTEALLQAQQTKDRADALFNLGNSYFYAGNLLAAADAFEGVMRYRPHDVPAKENLTRVRRTWALQNAMKPQQDGIPGRKGSGLGQNVSNAESSRSIEPEKDDPRPMGSTNIPNAGDATGLRLSGAKPPSELNADRRAALKKLDLLSDKRAQTYKQLLKQDSTREPPSEMPPW